MPCIHFSQFATNDSGLLDIYFENFLRAIEKSKLERFSIGRIESLYQIQTLTQSIPLMKLKELEIDFAYFIAEALKRDLLHAVKNNFSLRCRAL